MDAFYLVQKSDYGMADGSDFRDTQRSLKSDLLLFDFLDKTKCSHEECRCITNIALYQNGDLFKRATTN